MSLGNTFSSSILKCDIEKDMLCKGIFAGAIITLKGLFPRSLFAALKTPKGSEVFSRLCNKLHRKIVSKVVFALAP